MSSNHQRAIGVKDKDHGNHDQTSLYEPDETAKKHKRNETAMTRSSRGSYS
jgi:hypothetical protein